MLPTDGGEHFSKRMDKIMKESVEHKNSRWHANFTRLQVRCIQYFLLFGLWRLKMHKSSAVVRFLIGSWSEKERNQMNKGAIGRDRVTKIAVLLSSRDSKR